MGEDAKNVTRYAALLNPGHNRVYYAAAKEMAAAELAVAANATDVAIFDAALESIGGVDYLKFSVDAPLNGWDIGVLSRLSFLYALFELRGDVLIPVEKARGEGLDDALGSMQKYKGKTNELFTRMMINLAQFACGAVGDKDRRLRLLDPMAGRGTTLFEAASLGMDACGIDIHTKSIEEAQLFFKKYLEQQRYRFEYKREAVGIGNKKCPRYIFRYAPDKVSKKEHPALLELVAADALAAERFYPKNHFDLIVFDLPYGVQSASVKGDVRAASRNPRALLGELLPLLHRLLKKGGGIAASFNINLTRRAEIVALFADAGFAVFDDARFTGLTHRVEQAITRDLVVAKK